MLLSSWTLLRAGSSVAMATAPDRRWALSDGQSRRGNRAPPTALPHREKCQRRNQGLSLFLYCVLVSMLPIYLLQFHSRGIGFLSSHEKDCSVQNSCVNRLNKRNETVWFKEIKKKGKQIFLRRM